MRLIVTACLMAVAPLLFAQQLPQAAGETGKCAIEGRVVHYVTGKPVPQASLTLRMPSQSASPRATKADDEGRFSIADLDPGSYTLYAERSGFLKQAYGARSSGESGPPFKLAPGQRMRDLVFRLIPQAVVTGKVLDDRGEPVDRALVSLLRDRGASGEPRGTTNDLGEFRMSGVFPGRYLFEASGAARRDSAPPEPGKPVEVLLPTLYPSARDVSGAAPLEIEPGQELSGLTVIMRRGPVYRVRGKIAGATGAHVVTLLLREPAFSSRAARELFAYAASSTANPDGSFEISGVRPGSYYLKFARGSSDTFQSSELLSVDVTNEDVDLKDLTLLFRGSLIVAGTLRVEGDDKRIPVSSKVSLRTASPRGSSDIRAVSPRPDGSFRFTGLVSPGSYYIQLLQSPPDFYVKSVRMGDQEVRDSGLDLTGGQATITILLGAKPATVTGTVKLDDTPASGMWVALVPDQYVPSGPTELRTATSDQNGHVRFAGVPPGEYRLYAWGEEQYAPGLDTDFLKPFQSKSAKVSAKEGDVIPVEVTAIRAEGSPAR